MLTSVALEGMLSVLNVYLHPHTHDLSEWNKFGIELCYRYFLMFEKTRDYEELRSWWVNWVLDYAGSTSRLSDVHSLFHERAVDAYYAAIPLGLTPNGFHTQGVHVNGRIVIDLY